MFIVCAVVVVALVGAIVGSAVRKLSRAPDVVASYEHVGVTADQLPALAAILLAGSVGLGAGLAWAPLGLAAAACLVLYFVLAVGAHLRAGDHAHVATPAVLLVASTAALILRAMSL